MAITTLTIDNLYHEIVELAREQGAQTRELWNEIVDEVVEGHIDLGELDADQNTEGMKEVLRAKWNTFREELAEEEKNKDEFEEDTTTVVEEKKDMEEKEEEEDTDDFLGNNDEEY
ncbi:MAG: hypothetical protein A3I29_00330 [Candidatus Magasanikbacteria bacterium RIFCSPLOWO2_02_FULL_44_11]|uniref:Uncharacterized protein n=2 Tax=Candidatus Magasanikiibacteriota TaxID=1752731 RepID=A0A1F6N9Q3_9BACT|nr:MAG: hypothetical protein A3D53_03270 [Candidatus Magasanikbacteria bacterium RIFCSPHIGHO2_02_FULL_45_10]OGH80450.1 MAG: hypothetical protein A3I29_00330 [Candidatus Magasanikbacteria bacterium RIFCSPLOWO2_02_FULL_44_11]